MVLFTPGDVCLSIFPILEVTLETLTDRVSPADNVLVVKGVIPVADTYAVIKASKVDTEKTPVGGDIELSGWL